MKTNHALRIAVLCLLGAASHETMADVAWGTPMVAASEIGSISAGTPVTLGHVTNVPILTSKNILNTTFYYVKLTLTGGATFSSDVDNANKLSCKYSAAEAYGTTPVLVQIPGKDKNEVTYLLSSGTLAADAACQLPNLQIALNSGIKTDGYGLQAFVNYNTVEASTTSTNSTPLLTFAQALSVKAETVNSNGKVTVDVRSPSLSKGFVKAASNAATDYTAIKPIGKISYSNGAGVKLLDGSTNARPSDYISKFSITVSGLPLAAAAGADGQVRSGGLFLAADETCAAYFSGGAPVEVSPVAKTQMFEVVSGSVTLNVESISTNLNGRSPVVCMMANGLTSLPKGTVKFSVAVTPISPATPNVTVVDNTLSSFVKNGASVKVLNIPSSTNYADASFIRIYNMSDAEATVYGTLYNQGSTDASGVDTGGGTVIGKENIELGKIPARSVIVVSPSPANASTINLTNLVGTTWEGKAWMQVESDVQQLRVQALVRTGGAGGVTVNVSERIKSDGECVQRSNEDICK